MKKICFYLLAICLLTGTACEKEKGQVIECKLCVNFDTLEILNDEDARIIKTDFPDDGVDSFYIALKKTYAHTIVPCDILPEKYRKEGLKVKVSGIITGCFVHMYEPNPFAKFIPSKIFILTKIE